MPYRTEIEAVVLTNYEILMAHSNSYPVRCALFYFKCNLLYFWSFL